MNSPLRYVWFGALFVGFFIFFKRGGEISGTTAVTGAAGLFLVLFGFFYRQILSKQKHWLKGTQLLSRGRLVEAVAQLEPHREHAAVTISLGYAYLSLWKFRESLACCEQFLTKHAKKGLLEMMAGSAHGMLALNHALNGNLAGATGAIELTRRADAEGLPYAALAEVVLLCRGERWSEAQQALARNEVDLDQLVGVLRALRDAVEAWVTAQTGSGGGQVNAVRLFREAGPDSLRQAWPQFVGFVESRTR